MILSVIWTGMVTVSVVFGLLTGRGAAVGAAAAQGCRQAVELCLGMAGVVCLWSGVMEVLKRSGLSGRLARLLHPLLGRLYPDFRGDGETMEAISANVTANLLGLGSAATPLGLRAARRMAARTPGWASDSLCMLVVCNTASIQLLPTTVAALRGSLGCETPFDILPAVWLASAVSVTVGVLAARIGSRLWRERR